MTEQDEVESKRVWDEFSGLSRAERHGRVWDAVYLPLEVAATVQGDPALAIDETIDSLLSAYDSKRGRRTIQ